MSEEFHLEFCVELVFVMSASFFWLSVESANLLEYLASLLESVKSIQVLWRLWNQNAADERDEIEEYTNELYISPMVIYILVVDSCYNNDYLVKN